MRTDSAGERVVHEVDSPGGVRLHSTVHLTKVDGGTRVDEQIEVTMPRLLAGFVLRQARAAQPYWAQELTRRFS